MIGDVRDGRGAGALLPLLADAAPRARFFAAEALGRLAYGPAIPALVQMLADNDDRDVNLRHAGSLALARIGDASPSRRSPAMARAPCGSPPSSRCGGCAIPTSRASSTTRTSSVVTEAATGHQ